MRKSLQNDSSWTILLGDKRKENRKGDREKRKGKGWGERKTKGKKLKGRQKG